MVQANPLPVDGIVGKLTPEQTDKLKLCWKQLFELIDAAPEHGTSSTGNNVSNDVSANQPTDPEASVRNRPKDDAAKEAARANEEVQNAKLALEQYGRTKFLATFWAFIAMDHPDAVVLKYLRARKWNPAAGVSMLAACMKWRIESGVQEIPKQGEEGYQHREGFLTQMSSGKGFIFGSDRQQRPVIYINVRLHKASDQPPKALEDFVLLMMESLRCMSHDDVDKPRPVEMRKYTKLTYIPSVNTDQFGLSNMDWRCVLFIVKCLESYYPESLNAVLVHRPPWIFSGIWKVLAPMLDPVVRSKIHMTKTIDDLCVFVDKSKLWRSLGGENAWEYKYVPFVPGENKTMEDTQTRDRLQAQRDELCSKFTEHTRRWITASNDDHDIERERIRLARHLRAQYFKIDPYIRARVLPHRLGNIVGNGLLVFDYPGVNGTNATEHEVIGFEGCKENLEALLEISPESDGMPNEHLSHNDESEADGRLNGGVGMSNGTARHGEQDASKGGSTAPLREDHATHNASLPSSKTAPSISAQSYSSTPPQTTPSTRASSLHTTNSTQTESKMSTSKSISRLRRLSTKPGSIFRKKRESSDG